MWMVFFYLALCVLSHQRNKHPSMAINSLEVLEEDHFLLSSDTEMKTTVRGCICAALRKHEGNKVGRL